MENIVRGIERLLKETGCKVWVETLFVKGINDSPREVERIGEIIHALSPHKWQLNTVARPPAYGVEGLTFEELHQIAEKVGYPATEIVARSKARRRKFPFSQLKEEVYGIVVRRPCPVEEIADALGVLTEEVERAVEELKKEGRVEEVIYGGEPYVKGISA